MVLAIFSSLKGCKPYPDSGISERRGKGCRSTVVKLENNF